MFREIYRIYHLSIHLQPKLETSEQLLKSIFLSFFLLSNYFSLFLSFPYVFPSPPCPSFPTLLLSYLLIHHFYLINTHLQNTGLQALLEVQSIVQYCIRSSQFNELGTVIIPGFEMKKIKQIIDGSF